MINKKTIKVEKEYVKNRIVVTQRLSSTNCEEVGGELQKIQRTYFSGGLPDIKG